MTPSPDNKAPTCHLPPESLWQAWWRQQSPAVQKQIRRWQEAPRVRRPRPQWHLVVAIDGEQLQILECSTLKELVQRARNIYRLEERYTQIFIFRGIRFLTEQGPSKRIILSRRKRVPLVPIDRRADLAPDYMGELVSPHQEQIMREHRQSRPAIDA